MAKSARASKIKKNNQALKKRVFGPVEAARNERLSAKLLELAKAPKEKEQVMDDVESPHLAEEEEKTAETDMNIDLAPAASSSSPTTAATAAPVRSKREVKRLQAARAERTEKHKRRKPRNLVKFPTPASRKRSSRR